MQEALHQLSMAAHLLSSQSTFRLWWWVVLFCFTLVTALMCVCHFSGGSLNVSAFYLKLEMHKGF